MDKQKVHKPKAFLEDTSPLIGPQMLNKIKRQKALLTSNQWPKSMAKFKFQTNGVTF